MSNSNKDHPSARVQAPSGGHSNNFGTEFEQSAANKKKHMGSDIFGTKQDNVDPAPTKQSRNTGNNIFGNEPEETHAKGGTIAGQFKQTQMKSNIFGTDEPASARSFSDMNKSNIFGVNDKDEQSKRPTQVRQGLRVGYNPINGESYALKDDVNSKTNENDKQTDSTVKKPEEENGNGQATSTNTAETGNDQKAAENGNGQAAATKTSENNNAQKPVEKVAEHANGNNAQKSVKPEDNTKGDNAQKNVHTSVRVFHPPGGKSNGPLW